MSVEKATKIQNVTNPEIIHRRGHRCEMGRPVEPRYPRDRRNPWHLGLGHLSGREEGRVARRQDRTAENRPAVCARTTDVECVSRKRRQGEAALSYGVFYAGIFSARSLMC